MRPGTLCCVVVDVGGLATPTSTWLADCTRTWVVSANGFMMVLDDCWMMIVGLFGGDVVGVTIR